MACSVDGCERADRARGWCRMHYERWRVHGDVFADVPVRRGRALRPVHLPADPLVAAVPVPRPIRSAAYQAWFRARRSGRVTVAQADRLCTQAGLHPADVYGSAWWSA